MALTDKSSISAPVAVSFAVLPSRLPELPPDVIKRFPSFKDWYESMQRVHAKTVEAVDSVSEDLSKPINDLKAATSGNLSVVSGALSARIDEERDARIDGDTALATTIASIVAAAGTGNQVFVQSSTPTANNINDIWLDSDDGFKTYYWNGTTWVDATDTRLPGAVAAITAEASVRASADATLTSTIASAVSSLSTLTSDFTSFSSTVTTTYATKTYADTKKAEAISAAGTYSDAGDAAVTTAMSALVSSEASTRAAADAAEATLRLAVRTDFIAADAVVASDAAALVAAEAATRSAADAAEATLRLAVRTDFVAADAVVASNAAALVTAEAASRSAADSAEAALRLQVRTDFVAADATVTSNMTALVNSEATTRSTADAALASSITSVTSIANSKAKITVGSSTPTSPSIGDLWVDTGDLNKTRYWDGSAWTYRQDGAIVALVTSEASTRAAADSAEATARLQVRTDFVAADAVVLTQATALVNNEASTRSAADSAEATARLQVRSDFVAADAVLTTAINTAQSAANTAQSAANAAQSSANTALSTLTDIASDSLLTPDEKPMVIQDYNVIIAEEGGIQLQAMTFAITNIVTNTGNLLAAQWGSVSAGTATPATCSSAGSVGPNGETAFRVQADRGSSDVTTNYSYWSQTLPSQTNPHTTYVTFWAKSNTGSSQNILVYFANSGGITITITTSWQQFTLTSTVAQTGEQIQFGTRGGKGCTQVVDFLLFSPVVEVGSGSLLRYKYDYETAVTALTTYLATLTSPVAWNTIPGNTTIVGTTFRSKFSDVYTTRQVVLNKIYANAKVLADTAQASANTNTAAITTESSTRATADTALATSITTLTSTVNLKNQTFYSSSTPTAVATGDIWVDTGNGNALKRWNGSSWVDTTIAAGAITAAITSEATTRASGDAVTANLITTLTARIVGTGGDLYTATIRNGTDLGGGSYKKTGGVAATWDCDFYSSEGYTNGAYVSFLPAQTTMNFMVGLNTDPTLNNSYTSIDYAWHMNAAFGCEIYESGVFIGAFGSYTTSTVFTIVYNGSYVRYYKDGVLQREVAASANITLYLDASMYTTNAQVNKVRFGPSSPGLIDAIAQVSTEATARATADGNLSSKYTLKVTAGNVVTGMNITSSTSGGTDVSDITFQATSFKIYNGTTGVAPFQVIGGSVRITGSLILSPSDVTGLGSLATQNSVNLNSSEVTNKSLANLDSTASTKLGTIATGADVTLTAVVGGLSLTGGGLILASGGASVRSGQTAYDTGTGFWLGDVSGTPKFSIGNASGNKLLWNGTSLSITGTITGSDIIVTSGVGMRYIDDNNVFTITGGSANGTSHGAQIDLAGTGLGGGVGGVLSLAAGNTATGSLLLRTGASVTRIEIDYSGSTHFKTLAGTGAGIFFDGNATANRSFIGMNPSTDTTFRLYSAITASNIMEWDLSTGFVKVNGNQVLAGRQAAITDPGISTVSGTGDDSGINSSLANLQTALRAVIARMVTHGLIAP